MLAATLWGMWATREIVDLKHREVVTVKLSVLMGDFVAAEARSGRDPDDIRTGVAEYLKAVEASVAALSREGRTVLVAEAVVAGTAPDLTSQVQHDVARRLGVRVHAAR
jgi:hypothetical protein